MIKISSPLPLPNICLGLTPWKQPLSTFLAVSSIISFHNSRQCPHSLLIDLKFLISIFCGDRLKIWLSHIFYLIFIIVSVQSCHHFFSLNWCQCLYYYNQSKQHSLFVSKFYQICLPPVLFSQIFLHIHSSTIRFLFLEVLCFLFPIWTGQSLIQVSSWDFSEVSVLCLGIGKAFNIHFVGTFVNTFNLDTDFSGLGNSLMVFL